MKGVTLYLNKYYKIQPKIVLVKRKDSLSSWSDRCLFLDEKYSPHKEYNHRSILEKEVVLEYDYEDKALNDRLSTLVCTKLNNDGIVYSRWRSGNKSQHIHFFINPLNAKNIPLLKNSILRHYGTFYQDIKGKITDEPSEGSQRYLPDLRLTSNHLIRAENGLHEKTGEKKSLMYTKGDYPTLNDFPQSVWDRYIKQQKTNLNRRFTKQEDDEETKNKIQVLLNTSKFKEFEDGRERALFILIHYLKDQYEDRKEELITYLKEWYRYTGGNKLRPDEIARKVSYHWNRTYRIDRILDELLESIM